MSVSLSVSVPVSMSMHVFFLCVCGGGVCRLAKAARVFGCLASPIFLNSGLSFATRRYA